MKRDLVHARNAQAWALGYPARGGFHVRRVVWGRALAREEKRDGEQIARAVIMIRKPAAARAASARPAKPARRKAISPRALSAAGPSGTGPIDR